MNHLSNLIRLAISVAMCGLSQGNAQPLTCLMSPNAVAEVGTQVTGVLESLAVERGAVVSRGQQLARLKSDVESASVRVASARAEAQAELKAAEANLLLAHSKLERNEDLYRRNFVSVVARDEASTEAQIARARVSQARETLLRAERELSLANAQLEQRVIRSPISGVVIERYLSVGERADDKPILKVASLDPLRIEVLVPAMHFARVSVGMTGKIRPDVNGFGEFDAKVVLVDRVIDPASNTFRARLELPNPNNEIPSGMRCKADLGLESGLRAQAQPASTQTQAGAASHKGPDSLVTAGIAPRLDDKAPVAPAAPVTASATGTPGANPESSAPANARPAPPSRGTPAKREPSWWDKFFAMLGFKASPTSTGESR